MAPIIQIYGIEVHSWGFFHGLAACLCLIIILTYLRKNVKNYESYRTLIFLSVGTPVAYGFSRLLEVLHTMILCKGHLSIGQALMSSGSTSVGVVLAAILLVILTSNLIRTPTNRMLTALALALPITVIIGRIGCLLAGDGCYGVQCDLPWAMRFPNGTIPTSSYVHPIPMYEIVNMLVLLVAIGWIIHSTLWKQIADSVYVFVFVAYSMQRFVLEYFRPYARLEGLTFYQWLTVLIVVIITGYAWKNRDVSNIYRRLLD